MQVLWVSRTDWEYKIYANKNIHLLKMQYKTWIDTSNMGICSFFPLNITYNEDNIQIVSVQAVIIMPYDTLTVAPSLMDIGFDFFAMGLLMLKPILETLGGAGRSSEESSSSSGMSCWDLRLTAAPSPPTELQETGLVFTLSPSSCGPA